MRIKKLLLTIGLAICCFCLTMPVLVNATKVSAESMPETKTSWILERTDASAYSSGNYRCIQLFTSYAAAPMFNGTETYWGFSVKNHLNSEAMIRFGYSMGGGVTVWMGGANSVYYLADNDGNITKLQGVAAQNIKIPKKFDGIVFWNPAEGYNYNDKIDTIAKNKYKVKGLQVGYDFRSGYSAKLEFSNLYVANITINDELTTISNLSYKGNLDTLDTGYPKWANLGSVSDKNTVTAMQNGVTISQFEFNLRMDIDAANVCLKSIRRIVQLPCVGVVSDLITTEPELKFWLEGKNALCEYLINNVIAFHSHLQNFPWSKQIWDIAPIAYLLNENNEFMITKSERRPTYTKEFRANYDEDRGTLVYVSKLYRDKIFADLFKKLSDEKLFA